MPSGIKPASRRSTDTCTPSGHCEQAEDLTQEVFVKAWQRLPVRQRELLLSRAEGDTLAQLARKEGCHRSKIMRRLVHARATLRHHSRQVGGEA